MKNLLALFLLFIFFQNTSWSQKALELDDFTLKEMRVEEFNQSYWLLILNNVEDSIAVITYTEPESIVASYFDDQYLIIIFQTKRKSHIMTGIYKHKNKWITDYFYKYLDYENGMYEERVSEANFLDGEIVILTYDINKPGRDNSKKEKRILRITKDYINIFVSRKSNEYHPPGNNPIRPIE